jgi:hypothetical protein
VQKVVSEQGGVEGQRKEVNVGDYANVATLGLLLKDLEFPVSKNKIIEFIQRNDLINISKEKKEVLLNTIRQNLEEQKQYQNVSEVTRAAGPIIFDYPFTYAFSNLPDKSLISIAKSYA